MTQKKFTTFEGVFTPTFLSILGVIMYLRLGWVVGHAGLRGALLIIVISNIITLCTGLSISSIATNSRIGTGGAYTMIAKSLGLQVGGAIGIPLYLSQAISVAFYITGFTECWIWVFPQHDFMFVSLILWTLLFCISFLSARLAFRLQFIVMAVILGSVVSIVMSDHTFMHRAGAWAPSGEVPFWAVFAVFFPAVTGILAGVSMSGELRQPQKSLPIGTLTAIVLGFIVYVGLAVWFALSASTEALTTNTLLVLDLARWRLIVIAGIMGATLSSALSMFVAAPRTLLALGKHHIIPASSLFFYTNSKGEPTRAILFTAIIALITISLGTLNAIAGLLTMFFLITYGMLNLSVFIEKATGIVSFRPTFKVPLIISLIGGAGCFWIMFLINARFSAAAIIVITVIYIILIKSRIHRNWPDVRKGLFIFMAEHAIRVARTLPYHPKIWKPNLLIPVEEPKDWKDVLDFIRDIAFPNGRVDLFSIEEKCIVASVASGEEDAADTPDGVTDEAVSKNELVQLTTPLRDEGLFVSAFPVTAPDFLLGATIVLQTLRRTAFPPNVLFLKLGQSGKKDWSLHEFVLTTECFGLGIMLYKPHPVQGLGERTVINLWIREGSPNVDLAVLAALQLGKNWDGRIRLVQVIDEATEYDHAYSYLEKLKRLMRLPNITELTVLCGRFPAVVEQVPAADINIFGMPEALDLAWVRQLALDVDTATLFVRDSQQENAIV